MKQRICLKIGLVSAFCTLMAACASTPEPVQTTDVTPPPAVPERPVFVDPAPQVQAPVTPIPYTGPPVENYTGPMPGSVDDFIQNAGDRIFFGYNQYSLTTEARNVLRSQAQWLSSYPQAVAVIGGHADERGTREYNLALGARRADAVKDFLVSQGVDPGRITTVSYGKERPIDGRSNEQAWAMNRNGHTAIVGGASS